MLINLKKTKSCPKIALEVHEYLESEFIFAQAELTKRGPHVVADEIRVITKLPNSEQSYKGKVKTHKYINRQNESTTGKL